LTDVTLASERSFVILPDPSATEGEAVYRSTDPVARPAAVLAIASAATFVAFLDVTIVNIAFPDLERDFSGASLSLLSWVVAAYGIAFAATLAPAGRLADVLGLRRLFLIGFGTFIAASAACALAPTVGVLIAVRAVQGIGAAMMIPAGLGLILSVTPPERRAAAIGVWGGVTSIAAIAGPVVGGVLVDAFDWRAVFAVNIPIGILVLAAAPTLLPSSPARDRRLPDLTGTVALAAAFAAIAVALTQAGDWGWLDSRTVGFAGAGLLLLAASVRRAAGRPAPALQVDLWTTRNFAVANVALLLWGAVLFSWLLSGVLFLTSIWGYSIVEAGLAVSPGALTSAIAAVAAGRLIDRRGARELVVASALLLAADAVWIAAASTSDPNFLGLWLPAGILCGIPFGIVSVGLTSAAVRSLPPESFAAGTGMTMTARQLGGAFGVALMASILEAAGPGIGGFHSVFLFCAAGSVLTSLVALRLGRAPAPVTAAVTAEVSG
jgi:EmrB/QacA subfamily drug resistance transporter